MTPISTFNIQFEDLVRNPRSLTLAPCAFEFIQFALQLTQITLRPSIQNPRCDNVPCNTQGSNVDLAPGMTAPPCDNTSSAAQRRREEQLVQALKDAQDAVEQVLCDANLRIARTRFYDAFIVPPAVSVELFPEAFVQWKDDVPFFARVLL